MRWRKYARSSDALRGSTGEAFQVLMLAVCSSVGQVPPANSMAGGTRPTFFLTPTRLRKKQHFAIIRNAIRRTPAGIISFSILSMKP